MNKREKILAIGVGSVMVLAGCQYVLSSYRAAVKSRSSKITVLDDQLFQARDKGLAGAIADRQMGDYLVRSLPSNPERAQADYMSWLLDTITIVDIQDGSVLFTNSNAVGDLYQRYAFKVSGKTDARGWVELLHSFYTKDYLHRIAEMTVRPNREGGLSVDLSIEAIGLGAAAPNAAQPGDSSPFVGKFDAYADAILNRNFFSGPNQLPRFTSPDRLTTEVAKPTSIKIEADDSEKHSLRFALAGDVPEGLSLDEKTGAVSWTPGTKGEFPLTIKVTDDGYPPQSVEQSFTIAVTDPPPTPETPKAAMPFDDSTQTVLTALLKGGGDGEAWMKVKTRGTTLKLRPGDQFDIGSLKGSVIAVNAKSVVLEIDGRTFEMRSGGVLSEAAKVAP